MTEFYNSEHTGVSGTAKLARNECPNVKNWVQNGKKWQKIKVGPIAMSALTWQSNATWHVRIG